MDKVWAEIEKEASGKKGQGMLKRLIFPDSPIGMFLGIQIPSFQRLFLIQVPCGLIPSNEVLPQSRGFSVRSENHDDEPTELVTLVINVSAKDYNDLFSSLVRDVVEHISEKKDYKSVVNALLERLGRWQRFFDRLGPQGLGEEAQRGLYGELWLLREYLLKNISPHLAVASWTGPNGTPQDYQLPHCWVEVKTSIAKQHQKLPIANERQLDDSNTEALFIFHLSLEASCNQGENLADMVSSVRSLLKNSPESLIFEELLFEAGYLSIHESRYKKTGYSIRESNFFKVEEGFPRIIEKDLPNGVGDVKYSVSIAECKHHSVDESFVLSTILGGKNG